MPEPLFITKARLPAHFIAVENILKAATNEPVQVIPDWDANPVGAGLAGTSCEYVTRNRGASQDVVAPLLPLRGALWAWLGYREEWEYQGARGQRLVYRTAGFTIYFGRRTDPIKLQVFRAEWPGWACWNSADYGYQAPGAGHPHWQIDIVDSLLRIADQLHTSSLQRLLQGSQDYRELREFVPDAAQDRSIEDEIQDLLHASHLSRLHLASAAAWWKGSPLDSHVHAPTLLADLESWVSRSISYVVSELKR